jgi:nucleoside-diphosphate-sugar epimerase
VNPDLKGRSIALIGGAGFIGHHLAVESARSGANVHVIDRLPDGNVGGLYAALIRERLAALREAEVSLHVLDARESEALAACLQRIEPDAIVHLAAVASAGATDRDPPGAFDHGLRTLVNALEYARGRPCHLVYVSSSMVYGNFKSEAAMEEDVCEPIGVYGALKCCGERMAIAYGQVFHVPCTIVRPSAVYGERCVGRSVGQIYIENALLGKALTVKGDGSDALDFTYVRDLVQGLTLCLTRREARNQVFNLTFGDARTLQQMTALLERHFPEVVVHYEPREPLAPKRGTLSIGKARRLLGYAPEFPLETGFVRYIDWYKDLARRHPGFFEDSPRTNSRNHSSAMSMIQR